MQAWFPLPQSQSLSSYHFQRNVLYPKGVGIETKTVSKISTLFDFLEVDKVLFIYKGGFYENII